MSVVWEKSFNNSFYRVTKAGNALRLYRNQVLHSQWNPGSPVMGKIWDMFLLCAVAQNHEIKNALVLGAGGGSVINLIHHFYPGAKIDAVDLDEMQLYIAKRFFKVSSANTKLINQNALDWLKNKHLKKYDLIVDDVFFESDNIPFRSIDIKKNWAEKLISKLTSNGSLVINFADQKEWKKSRQYIENIAKNKKYNIGIGIQKSCDNRIVFLSKNCLATKTLKNGLMRDKAMSYLKFWKNGMFSYRQLLRIN